MVPAHMRTGSDRAKHKVFTRALRRVGPGEAVEVPKTMVRSLPVSYERTLLGTPPALAVPGGQQQFRGPYSRHVYEKKRSWVVHRDTADPRQDPIEHLVMDAPELGAGFLASAVFGIPAARSSYERSLLKGSDRKTATMDAAVDGLVVGSAAFLAAFAGVRLLRTIFREQ